MFLDMKKLHPEGIEKKVAERKDAFLMTFWDDNAPDGLKQDMVEYVDCSLCGYKSPPLSGALFYKMRFPYLRCPGCGLIYPSPRPAQSIVSDSFIHDGGFISRKEMILKTAQYRMDTIFSERVKDILMPRVSKGRVLDIGCGFGHFLKVAENNGFEVYGVEPSLEASQFAQEELNLQNVKCGFFDDGVYEDEYFDVVTLWDVLEHVDNPLKILSSVSRILRKGGWVFAYTENFDSFNRFVANDMAELIAPGDHLRHYTPGTFRKEFENAGFTVETVCTKGLDIQHLIKSQNNYPERLDKAVTDFEVNDGFLQEAINKLGIGDNLRLFACKP